MNQPTFKDAYEYAVAEGIDDRQARAVLGSKYAFYHWRRAKEVYHVTDRTNVEAIMRDGLRRSVRRTLAGGRGIFFLTNAAHVHETLEGIDDPVVIVIQRAGILQLGTEERHDNHEDDWNLAAMYSTAQEIAPQYLSVREPESFVEGGQ